MQFDLAAFPTDDGNEGVLTVRRHVPPINRRHVRRLPSTRQAEHDAWVSAQLAEPAMAAARHNARRAAVVLFGMGERLDGVERALGSAGFAPALARDTAAWARDRLEAAMEPSEAPRQAA